MPEVPQAEAERMNSATADPNAPNSPKTQSAVRWSDLLDRAWTILKERGEMRGSDLGWELWGETTPVPNRGTGSQRHNKFCRPAGKVLKALERQGRVISVGRATWTAWKAVGVKRSNDKALPQGGAKKGNDEH